jgi:YHS domain-containing protein
MKCYLTLLIACLSLVATAQTEDAQRRRNFNLTDNGIGLREFDAVSYFKGRPTKGDEKFDFTYKGITYYFSNAENMEEFKKAPGKYEPAYGGWCAYSMGVDGQRMKIDPTTYKIIDGRLFLFHNFSGKNMLNAWNKNEKKLKASADQNWVKKFR